MTSETLSEGSGMISGDWINSLLREINPRNLQTLYKYHSAPIRISREGYCESLEKEVRARAVEYLAAINDFALPEILGHEPREFLHPDEKITCSDGKPLFRAENTGTAPNLLDALFGIGRLFHDMIDSNSTPRWENFGDISQAMIISAPENTHAIREKLALQAGSSVFDLTLAGRIKGDVVAHHNIPKNVLYAAIVHTVDEQKRPITPLAVGRSEIDFHEIYISGNWLRRVAFSEVNEWNVKEIFASQLIGYAGNDWKTIVRLEIKP